MEIPGVIRIQFSDPSEALIQIPPRPTTKNVGTDGRPAGSSEAENDLSMDKMLKEVAFGCYRPVTPPPAEGEGEAAAEGEGEAAVEGEGEGEGEQVVYNDKTVFNFECADPATGELGDDTIPYGANGVMSVEPNGTSGAISALEEESGTYSLNFFDVTEPGQYFVGGIVRYLGEDGNLYKGVEITINTHRTKNNSAKISFMDDDKGGWLPSMAGVVKAEDFDAVMQNQCLSETAAESTPALTADQVMFNLVNLSVIDADGVVLEKFRSLSEEELKAQLDSMFDQYGVTTTAEDGTVTMTGGMKDAIYQVIKNREDNNKVPVRGDKYEFTIPENITSADGVKVQGPDEKGYKKVFIPFKKFTKVPFERELGNGKLDINISGDQANTQGILEMSVEVQSTTPEVNWIDTTVDNVTLVDKEREIQ